MKYKDNIIGFMRLAPHQIVPHPLNYKLHTDAQRSHFRAILKEVGIGGGIVVRRVKGGKYQLIGGHMRREEIRQPIPALVIRASAQEAIELLAQLDASAELADTDETVMAELLDMIGKAGAEFNAAIAAMCPVAEPTFNAKPQLLLTRTPPPDVADEAEPQASTRQVPLVFSGKQKAEFLKLATKLNEKYKTDNYSDCVLAAFKEWNKHHGKDNQGRAGAKLPGQRHKVRKD